MGFCRLGVDLVEVAQGGEFDGLKTILLWSEMFFSLYREIRELKRNWKHPLKRVRQQFIISKLFWELLTQEGATVKKCG